MTAFKESRYLLDLTSLQGGKALTFHELPTPTLAFLREVNNSSFKATSKTTTRKWFFSAREKESLVACGLLAAALPETELREMLAIPSPKLIAEVRRFQPKFTKAWLSRGALMINLLEKLCSIDIQKDVEAALLAFHDTYDRSVVCASLPAVDLPEILVGGSLLPWLEERCRRTSTGSPATTPSPSQWSSSSNNSWRCTRGSSSL